MSSAWPWRFIVKGVHVDEVGSDGEASPELHVIPDLRFQGKTIPSLARRGRMYPGFGANPATASLLALWSATRVHKKF